MGQKAPTPAPPIGSKPPLPPAPPRKRKPLNK